MKYASKYAERWTKKANVRRAGTDDVRAIRIVVKYASKCVETQITARKPGTEDVRTTIGGVVKCASKCVERMVTESNAVRATEIETFKGTTVINVVQPPAKVAPIGPYAP